MKKVFLFFSVIFTIAFTACGPAAESRDSMMTRAKQVQDSIANSIKTAIQEVEATPNAVVVKDTTKVQPK
ncbi:MAG: hypothetical protein H0U95_14920 [Bacteroidetes bacterium]|nr:hypothetical protein [Bacteroidota bacterium]